jgi:hypothetical protein
MEVQIKVPEVMRARRAFATVRYARSRGFIRIHFILGFGIALFSASSSYSQQSSSQGRFIQITGGLGVSAHADPSIINYINGLTEPAPGQELSDFTTASEFFLVPEFQVSDEWSVGIEYSYLLKSYNVIGSYQWDFSYYSQMTTLLAHYLVPGDGYWLKFGGGVGYALGNFKEQFVESGASESSKASGPAFKVEAVGNTKFDDHFWGSIGVDLRWVYAGNFKGNLQSSASTPKLDFFSAGIKFGVTVQL